MTKSGRYRIQRLHHGPHSRHPLRCTDSYPCASPGKLPAETIEESYDKEYGKDTVQIHKDAIEPDDVVLLHDDLLATGGTMEAACKLVKKLNPKKVYVNLHYGKLIGREKRIPFSGFSLDVINIRFAAFEILITVH